MNFETELMTYTKLLKMIHRPNVNVPIIKLLEKNKKKLFVTLEYAKISCTVITNIKPKKTLLKSYAKYSYLKMIFEN